MSAVSSHAPPKQGPQPCVYVRGLHHCAQQCSLYAAPPTPHTSQHPVRTWCRCRLPVHQDVPGDWNVVVLQAAAAPCTPAPTVNVSVLWCMQLLWGHSERCVQCMRTARMRLCPLPCRWQADSRGPVGGSWQLRPCKWQLTGKLVDAGLPALPSVSCTPASCPAAGPDCGLHAAGRNHSNTHATNVFHIPDSDTPLPATRTALRLHHCKPQTDCTAFQLHHRTTANPKQRMPDPSPHQHRSCSCMQQQSPPHRR